MRRTIPIVIALVSAITMILTGCGGSSTNATGSGAGQTGNVVEGGILRIGTINYIDSFNPYHFIESQAYQAFIMLYPQLVQYDYKDGKYVIVGDLADSWDTSADGKDWTFHLKSGAKWSDGQPITAEDVAWTVNTTVKYASGPTAVMAPSVAHVKNAEAPDPTTVVLHYAAPVGNALAQLEQFFILPEHRWKEFAVGDGKGLKTYAPEQDMSTMVTGGAFTLKQYEKKGTTAFLPDPNYWGDKPHAQAVALTYYTNADSMIADMKSGQVDWVDQVPFNAVDVLKKDSSIVVQQIPGAETTNITWNSNPYKDKNRELLDPKVKKRSRCASTARSSSRWSSTATRTPSRACPATSPFMRTRTSARSSTTARRGIRCSTPSGTRRAPTALASRRRPPASTRSRRTRWSTGS